MASLAVSQPCQTLGQLTPLNARVACLLGFLERGVTEGATAWSRFSTGVTAQRRPREVARGRLIGPEH